MPLGIDGIADTPPLRTYLKFHCGCPLVERSQVAAFALVTDPANMPRLALFAQGVDQYPDRAATLLLQVPSLEGGPAVTLRGPGIRDTAVRSEEHTSELQSLMRISYAVFCLKKKKT